MERTRVQSDTLRSVGYDSRTATLEVQFRDGGVFQYFSVPQFLYLRLVGVGVKAGYFQDQVRRRFKFRRVG